MIQELVNEIALSLGLYDAPDSLILILFTNAFSLLLMLSIVLVPILLVFYIIKRFMED